ncbi:MAG: hypothetical protein U0359_27705 [Byssovorax sp.]
MATGFPIELETLLASTSEILKQNGNAREIAILISARPDSEQLDYDNWNGGTYAWGVTLAIDLRFYSSLKENGLKEAEGIICEAAQTFFARFENDHLRRVQILPEAAPNIRWREDAQRYLSGEGINNQGKVRSDNIASLKHEGLLFRSRPEINLFVALKSVGVPFAPLPVFLRGGAQPQRLEPDFVLIKDRVMMVVEVDGDTYHRETPAEAHARLQILDHEGAKIERVKAAECDTPEKAKECASRLIKILEKRIAQRG